MRARPRRRLAFGLVLSLVAGLLVGLAAVAGAEGTSSPSIVSPVSSVPEYEGSTGFTGPYQVDFSTSPAGTYEYSVIDAANQTVRGPTGYTSSGTETAMLRTSALPAGTYTFRVHQVADPLTVVDATSQFTVRAGAQPTCSVSVPRAVRMNGGEEIVHAQLTASCAAAHVSYASWDVNHVSRGFRNLMTFDHTARDAFSFFSADPLGTYVVAPRTATNPAADDIVQNSPRIDLRLDSRVRLSTHRAGRYVTLTATLTKFVRGSLRFGSWSGRAVALSYRTCGTCAWHYLRTRVTSSRGVAVFKVRAPHALRWRVTSSGTSVVWAPYPAYARR